MKLLYSIANGCVLALIGVAAHAADGYLVSSANLRAGPDTDYPIITTLRAGTALDIEGCIDGWEWCDVSVRGDRGWVAGRFLQYEYENRRVYVPEYGARVNIPIVSFVLGNYWEQNYRSRSWYRDRNSWSDRHSHNNTQRRSNDYSDQHRSNDYRDSSRQRSDNDRRRSNEQSQPQQESVRSSPRIRSEPSTPRTQRSDGWRDGRNTQQTQQSDGRRDTNSGQQTQQSYRGRDANNSQQTQQPRAPQVVAPPANTAPQPQARPAPAPAQQPLVSDPRTRSNAAKAQKDAEKKARGDKDDK